MMSNIDYLRIALQINRSDHRGLISAIDVYLFPLSGVSCHPVQPISPSEFGSFVLF